MSGPTTDPAAGWSTMLDVLEHHASAAPDAAAYVFLEDGEREGARLSYAETRARAGLIAAAIRARVAAGERVLLLLPQGLDFVASFLGCIGSGAVAVPAYPPRANRPLTATIAIAVDCQPALILTCGALVETVTAAVVAAPELARVPVVAIEELERSRSTAVTVPRPDPGDTALLQYTSGSTSAPRGVIVTQQNLLHNQRLLAAALGPLPGPAISWLPLYHDMGLIGHVLYPLFSGVTSYLMSPFDFLQRPARWLEAISRFGGSIATAPNFAYDLCVERIDRETRAGLDLSGWTLALNGAEPISGETIQRFAEAFSTSGFDARHLFPCYGLAEATLFVAGGPRGEGARLLHVDGRALERDAIILMDDDDDRARCLVASGKAWLDQRVLIVDPDTREPCGPDRIGEIWISGPSVAAGYWDRPAETAELFRATLASGDRRRYLRSGDLGFVRDEQLFVTGRIKDLLIFHGRNHYPQDIEQTAGRCHPALRPGGGAAFSARIGDAERLVLVHEIGAAHLSEAEEADILERMRRAVAEHHDLRLHSVALIKPGTLPRTTSGKVRRGACRQGFLERTLDRIEQ